MALLMFRTFGVIIVSFSFQGSSSRFSLAVSKLYLFLMQVFIAS